MNCFLVLAFALGSLTCGAVLGSCSHTDAAGRNGGDIVSIQNGDANAEVVANADSGEVMVHTLDATLRNAKPIAAESMMLGSGDQAVQLDPHPLASDPPGQSSRFYGQADWIRGGTIDSGWLRCCGAQGTRSDFAWRRCWSGGQAHSDMWSGMGEHRRGPMGMGEHGMGMHR